MIYLNRIDRARKYLAENEYDLMIVEEPTMLFYLTGAQYSAGTLLIHAHSELLLVDARYHESAVDTSPIPVALKEEKTLEEWLGREPFSDATSIIFDASHTSYRQFRILQELLDARATLKGVDGLFSKLRAVKDSRELTLLREAAVLGARGYDFVCDQLEEGITEVEVAKRLEIFWKQQGAQGAGFDPIIAFGKHTSMPHYHPSDTPLRQNQPVLIDIGVKINHYCSDMTRMVFFGTQEEEMLKIYDVARKAQEAAARACKPGITAADLDAVARDIIKEKGYGEFFTHSLGHGIGLNVHEAPGISSRVKAEPLLPGMVITIEPGIYLPDRYGVRIEDTVIITEEGCEDITQRSKDPLYLSSTL